jgi:hypothetical protein
MERIKHVDPDSGEFVLGRTVEVELLLKTLDLGRRHDFVEPAPEGFLRGLRMGGGDNLAAIAKPRNFSHAHMNIRHIFVKGFSHQLRHRGLPRWELAFCGLGLWHRRRGRCWAVSGLSGAALLGSTHLGRMGLGLGRRKLLALGRTRNPHLSRGISRRRCGWHGRHGCAFGGVLRSGHRASLAIRHGFIPSSFPWVFAVA